MTIHLHQGDLPSGLALSGDIAVDTETLGLRLERDALCLVQLADAEGEVHLVQMRRPEYDCPQLRAVLSDPGSTKIFHYARFDLAVLERWLGVKCWPVYCTKIASKLARTYSDRHGLKDLVRELVGEEISKVQQCSDWGAGQLNPKQQAYAAADVTYLHRLRTALDAILQREDRLELARACFGGLPARVELDLGGFGDMDIFAHS